MYPHHLTSMTHTRSRVHLSSQLPTVYNPYSLYNYLLSFLFISVINQLDAQKFCFTISLFHASTCFVHMFALHSLWYHHTYRCDDTRGCVMQFLPPDDENMCSKHIEA